MKTKENIIIDYDQVLNRATSLFNGIWEDASMWMQTPQDKLDGITPSMIVAIGQGQKLLKWLNQSDTYRNLPDYESQEISQFKQEIDTYLSDLQSSPSKDSQTLKKDLASKVEKLYKDTNPKKPLI